MPRRPCAITLCADDSTILCADKFGDIYALPLQPSSHDEQIDPPVSEPESKVYQPSASLSTVHSGRNRKTLEEQLKQAAKKKTPSKDVPNFKHDLLLGHVSMLTDIAFVNVGLRGYILTTDRDEHIRVSRGPPQAHIIEGFCFGHGQFVSRLCITESGVLVSGGGDPELYIWDWSSYRLTGKLPLREAVLDCYRGIPQLATLVPETKEDFKIAVSGVWSVPNDTSGEDEIFAACEGVPALFAFTVVNGSAPTQCLPTKGNVLDLTFIDVGDGKLRVVVSIDPVHKPGSTTELSTVEETPRLEYLSKQGSGQWVEDDSLAQTLDWMSNQAGARVKVAEGSDARLDKSMDKQAVRNVVYGTENLRKRPGAED